MSRWEPNARERLERAALELYSERGFDETTASDIAARAGLTERTFFRHYADKREVLFSGQESLIDLVVNAVAAQPESASALDATAEGFAATAPFFDERGEHARRRQRVVDANPSLQERELHKLATLAAALTQALCGRGVAPATARLTAEAGLAVFKVAFERWVTAAESAGMSAELATAFAELKVIAAPR